MLVMGEIPSP